MKKTLTGGTNKIIWFLLLGLCLSSCKEVAKVEMTLSQKGFDFIRQKEGLRLLAYNDGSGYAIGYGNTVYENGSPVQAGDRISQQRAETLFTYIAADFASEVNRLVYANINSDQLAALTSYAYNRGIGRFRDSSLLKMVNANPNNPAIREQFVIEWGSNKKYESSLKLRRKTEADLYFSGQTYTSTITNIFSGQYSTLIFLIILIIAIQIYLGSKKHKSNETR